MTERVLAQAQDYDQLVQAYRGRMAELGLTFETVDHLSGMQSGYTAKLLGPAQTKSLGPMSMGLLNQTLAVRLTMVEDVAAALFMAPRWERRERPAPPHANRLARIGKTTRNRVLPEVMREMGQRGGAVSSALMSPAKRRRRARIAAQIRWGKRKPQKRRTRPTSQAAP